MSLLKMSNEQKLIKSEVKKFAATELEPIAPDIEKNCRIPSSVLQKVAQMGLFALTIPEKYGGSGLDMTSLCVALEELSKSCASLGIMVAANNCLVANLLANYVAAGIKEEYLRKLASGGMGGYAPYSDLEIVGKEQALESEREGQFLRARFDIVLNGTAADFYVIPVKSDRGTSLYLFNKGSTGIETLSTVTMGMRSAGIVGLEFKHVALDANKCLVTDENGLHAVQSVLDNARIGFAAIALGLSEAALEASIKYAKERVQFGRTISEFPMVQEMLAEMKQRVDQSRFLVFEAANRSDSKEDYVMNARLACLTSCEGAVFNGLKAIQIHGGYGYIKDYPVERYFRDAKSVQLLGETPADLRISIAKELLT
jgi:butyryl-CoA dehydrogenase